jgi:hypothetical protein
MIDVRIIENNGLVALCTISGPSHEFRADLERLKQAVPYQDRDFVTEAEPKYFRVRHAEKYKDLVVEIGDAIELHKRQLRMF